MQRVLITRPRAQANDFANQLREAGFEPIFFPVIEIKAIENNTELDHAIKNIEKYAWIVFTSVNAVDVFFVEAQHVAPLPQIAAVGTKTADALRKHGIEPDFIPDEFVGVNIMSGLGDVKDKQILLPRAELASKALPEAIRNAGGIAHEIIIYRTLPTEIDSEGLAALKSGVDVVTFTSPSTVENFVEILRQHNISLANNPLIACIGTVTEKAAREAGFENIIVAKEFTTEGLVDVITETSKQVHK
jgi:uroporphyrinogen-III synthase